MENPHLECLWEMFPWAIQERVNIPLASPQVHNEKTRSPNTAQLIYTCFILT